MPLTKGKLKELRELTHKKNRDETLKFLVEGNRLVGEAVNSDFKILEAFHTADLLDTPGGKSLVQLLKKKTSHVHQVTGREMESISGTVSSQNVAAVVRHKRFELDSLLWKPNGRAILIALDGVSDPGNAGSMIRSSDWFGVDGILMGLNCVDVYNPKVVRATMGGLFHLPIVEGVDLLSTLSKAKSDGYKVYVTDVKGEVHFDRVRYDGKCILVFGNEAWGVSDQVKQLADIRLTIRRYGAAESLNVGVACGVVLSTLHRLYDE
jgi:TrmH family RNA methyltransferase